MAGLTRMNRRVKQRVALALAIAAVGSLSGAVGLLRPGSAAAAGPLESGPVAPAPTLSPEAKHDVALARYLGDGGMSLFLCGSGAHAQAPSTAAPPFNR